MSSNLCNFVQFYPSDIASFINYISPYGAELKISSPPYNINPKEYNYFIIHNGKEIQIERYDIVYVNQDNEFVIVSPHLFFDKHN